MNLELGCCIAAGAIVCAFFMTLCGSFMTGILQQGAYGEKEFLKWYYRKGNMLSRRYSLLALALFLLALLFNLCFSFAGVILANAISAVPFIGICLLFLYASKRSLKVPLKMTGRAIRLIAAEMILTALLAFGVLVGCAYAADSIHHPLAYLFRFVPATLFPLFMPLVLCLASVVMKGYEIPRNRAFVKKAKIALENSPCKKVGITGSFGKTSVKNYALALLSEKYKVIATPSSYNTPLGIARTVQESGLDCEIFLAEMGARKRGDIKELCELVKPEYGVVTGICPQHIATFGSIEAITEEKTTLAKYAKQAILGATVPDVQGSVFKEGKDFSIEEVALSLDGTEFTLCIGERCARVKTPLLGRHVAEDIALASMLAYSLGVPFETLTEGIGKLKSVPHRLEKIEANGLEILDDSYNTNCVGAQNAVEVLKLAKGKKYVVTPGIVELGEMEEQENKKLGALLTGLDGVILVGETRVLPVKAGYTEAGGLTENLRLVPTLEKAQEILKEELRAGDCVLFLNDLPDIY